MLSGKLMIDLDDAIVVIQSLENTQFLGRESEQRLRGIYSGKIVNECPWERRRLGPTLAFIVHKEERFVLLYRTAERSAKLILMKPVRLRRRLKQRPRVRRIIAKVVIYRAVEFVSAGLGDYVYDSSKRASVFGSETVVDDAEFADRLLRRSRALRCSHSVDGVGAINRDYVAQIAHAAE